MTEAQLIADYAPVEQLPAGPFVYFPKDSFSSDTLPETAVVAGPDIYSGEMRIVENVSVEGLSEWLDGSHIQNVFPDMDFADRAFLSAGGYLSYDG